MIEVPKSQVEVCPTRRRYTQMRLEARVKTEIAKV